MTSWIAATRTRRRPLGPTSVTLSPTSRPAFFAYDGPAMIAPAPTSRMPRARLTPSRSGVASTFAYAAGSIPSARPSLAAPHARQVDHVRADGRHRPGLGHTRDRGAKRPRDAGSAALLQ